MCCCCCCCCCGYCVVGGAVVYAGVVSIRASERRPRTTSHTAGHCHSGGPRTIPTETSCAATTVNWIARRSRPARSSTDRPTASRILNAILLIKDLSKRSWLAEPDDYRCAVNWIATAGRKSRRRRRSPAVRGFACPIITIMAAAAAAARSYSSRRSGDSYGPFLIGSTPFGPAQ